MDAQMEHLSLFVAILRLVDVTICIKFALNDGEPNLVLLFSQKKALL
jgi:hypothetical protein